MTMKRKYGKQSAVQFLKFCVVGVSNTVLAYLINITALKLLSGYSVEYDYVIANAAAFVISVFWSFMLNNRFVFQSKGNPIRTLLKTYAAYAFTGLFLNNILSCLWIRVFGMSKFIAPIPNLLISVPINFVINKYWAYQS